MSNKFANTLELITEVRSKNAKNYLNINDIRKK